MIAIDGISGEEQATHASVHTNSNALGASIISVVNLCAAGSEPAHKERKVSASLHKNQVVGLKERAWK